MSRETNATHLNAYEIELQEAQEEAVKANARVRRLKAQIDEKRAEQGIKPLYGQHNNDNHGKSKKDKQKAKDNDPATPDEATGFGSREKGGNS